MSTRPSKSSLGRPFSANRTHSGRTKTNPSGQKYPEIKQRGYYSDILGKGASARLGNVLVGPETKQDTLWKVATEDHTPMVTTFEMPDSVKKRQLKSNFGPSTEITAISDFPVRAYQPKVQLPFYTVPGQCPRKIEIERRKRHFAGQNLDVLLAQEGIDSSQLMPKMITNGNNNVILNANGKDPAPFPPFLPLSIFDDDEYDCRVPEDWIELGEENGVRKPVPCRALLPTTDDTHHLNPKDPSIEYGWFDAGMLDYDPESKLYLVQKINEEGRIVDDKGKPVVNGGLKKDGSRVTVASQYWIPRVRMMFYGEDPQTYTKRVVHAFHLRKHTEALLRYNLYVDCMPMDGVGELDQASLKRMIDRAKGAPSLAKNKNLDDYIQVLEKEVNIEFCRSMNRIIFDKTVQSDPLTFAYITVPPQHTLVVPEKGCCCDIPEYPFDEQYDNFAFNSLLTREESIQAIGKVRTECNKVSAMSLFHLPMSKPMRLEEFDQTQSSTTQQVALFLKDSWITTLRADIRTSLRDVGKGWFNIYEKNFEVYQISKLKKFMENVKFNMQDSLRYLVQDSLVNYTQNVLDACHAVLSLDANFNWGKDFLTSPFKPKRNALFLLDLVLDNHGSHFSTNLNNFEQVLVQLFDKAILSTQKVPQLEKSILQEIRWSGTPLLESVGEHEPPVEDLRDTVKNAIRKALIPMKAYAKEYDKYLELQNLDINAYVKRYDEENHSAVEVKAEVEMHLKEKEILEGEIPSNITIGPFYINTDGVRKNLSKKKVPTATLR